jgi:hypothetical protein
MGCTEEPNWTDALALQAVSWHTGERVLAKLAASPKKMLLNQQK